MHGQLHRLALIALCAAAACADGVTTVHVVVHGDASWGADRYELAVGERMKSVAVMPDFELLLPDDMADHENTIDIAALEADAQVAFGSGRVTPALHGRTSIDITLTAKQCLATCAVGDKACTTGGTKTCSRQADGCPGWDAVEACPSATPYCMDGACVATGGTCMGTPAACTTLGNNASCTAQLGCGWTALSCTGMATGCSDTSDPSVCSIRPQCEWDFNLTACVPASDWCQATSQSSCENHSGCHWTGGCSGTATACGAFSTSQCTHQMGCSL